MHAVILRVALKGKKVSAGPGHQLLFQAFWGHQRPQRKGTLPMSPHDRKQQRKARSRGGVRITAATGLGSHGTPCRDMMWDRTHMHP